MGCTQILKPARAKLGTPNPIKAAMKQRIIIADDDPTIINLVSLRLGMFR